MMKFAFNPKIKIRLGAISFVNTVPIYSDFQPGESIDLIYDVPARLNEQILNRQLDVSPVSSACYLRNKEQLVRLDDLSVSSSGAVESVIFISRKPLGPELLDSPAISVPDDSETSIALLAYLLKEATGQDLCPWFRTYQASHYQQALEDSGNALIIGDNALLIQQQGIPEGFHCYDLSTLWKERTGLPFVFAVWVASRSWAEAHPEDLRQLNRALREARNRFFRESSIFEAGMRLARSRSQLPAETLARYYRHCLEYTLTTEHLASLELFESMLGTSENKQEPSIVMSITPYESRNRA
ncbi:MAG TPA: menaquinone biosynthesis protein [Coleofasciculaceae cyanobacterium]|jgi:chorismate dehydratase